jgi:chemotaxis protein methyltransferase CheR
VVESKKVLPPLAAVPKVIRVFCVDDSTSIHTLMKQILKPDQGFEIVGQAMNGVEAAEKLKKLKGVDVVTLDIHMPEMTGIEYLEKHFGTDHPPVVMVSSVSRDQSELPLRTLKLGASDYVEKPALNALQERGEELRAKLKTAVLGRNQTERSLRLEEEFKKKVVIAAPERKVRVLASGLAHLKKTAQFLKDLDGTQPPVHILFEGVAGNLPEVARELSFLSGKKVVFTEDTTLKARPGEIRVLDFKQGIEFISKVHAGDRVSVSVLGEWGRHSALEIKKLRPAQLLLEDLGNGKGAEHLQHIASDVFPSTSFPFLGSQFFAKGDV